MREYGLRVCVLTDPLNKYPLSMCAVPGLGADMLDKWRSAPHHEAVGRHHPRNLQSDMETVLGKEARPRAIWPGWGLP